MHSPYIKLFGLTVLIVTGCALIAVMSRGHWWKKLSNAHVVYDGQSLPNASVYRSPNDELLVSLGDLPDERSLFVVYPAEKNVGLPNERHFVFLPGYVYSRYRSPLVVLMGSVKAETDPKVARSQNSVEFTTLRGRKVQILFE